MNATVILENAKVFTVQNNHNEDNTITWKTLIFTQGSEINKCTVDKELADQLETGETYDLLITVSEVTKSTTGGRIYLSHKFKVTGVYEQ